VGDAFFVAPCAVSFAWNLFFGADSEVLVLGDEPVFRGGLVKDDGADGLEILPGHFIGE